MSLKGIARETLSILDAGHYTNPSKRTVSIQPALSAAVSGTVCWQPEALASLPQSPGRHETVIEVTAERTQQAAHRLVTAEGEDPVLLSFASARNVCGGFVNGARAQEEDIARCSGTHACLRDQHDYYEANRAETTLLYTDHLIYSPRVPFFRLKNRDLLEAPYLASVITAPAPNAGQARRRNPEIEAQLAEALHRRAGYVLALAASQHHDVVLLGAWGCGVFQNAPESVALVLRDHLEGWAKGLFRRVVFGVYDPGRRQTTLGAFQDVFSR
jgi:uncharacterized protein (TIGR02452 family)